MKKKYLVLVVMALFLVSCSDKENSDSSTNKSNVSSSQSNDNQKEMVAINTHKPLTLQDRLDELLKYNGKECSRPASPLSIKSVNWDTDSSDYTTKTMKHTNVYKNSGGSYTTHDYTTGGDTRTNYYGATLYVEIENRSDKIVRASLDVKLKTTEYSSGFFGLWAGYDRSNTRNVYETFDVPPGGKKFSKYIKFDGYISDTPDAKVRASYQEEDDKRFRSASTIEEYHKYLQHDGCHYYIQEAQQKIRELFNQKIYDEAMAHTKTKDRIVALEKYLEVFNNTSNGKLANKQLELDKRMVTLLEMTQDYKTVLWEINNPLLYSYTPALQKDTNNDDLRFFTYDYIATSKERYLKQIAFQEKPIPIEPIKENFGIKPIKPDYPSEPNMQKGEFEKLSDFTLRKNEAYGIWEKQKSDIDAKYQEDFALYQSEQNKLYTQAYTKWQEEKRATIEENQQGKLLYEQKVTNIDKNRNQWRWEAVLAALGKSPLEFERLDYDSERELFEYVLVGGDLSFKFQGTIHLPIEDAKAFKEAMLSEEKGISFGMNDDTLYVDKFLNKGEYYPYTVTNGTQLVLIDMREIKKREEERKAEAERIARENLWLITDRKNEVFADYDQKLIWQDTIENEAKKRTWKDATSYCKKLLHDGYSDWRLPSSSELKNLVKYKNQLQYTKKFGYWSSTDKGWAPEYEAEYVDFEKGHIWSRVSKGKLLYVRCTRQGKNKEERKLEDPEKIAKEKENRVKKIAKEKEEEIIRIKKNKEEELQRNKKIKEERIAKEKEAKENRQAWLKKYQKENVYADYSMKLVWQDDFSVKITTKNWVGAIEHCKKLSLAGYNDWRLPSKNELHTVATIKNRFINDISKAFWSSSEYAEDNSRAWEVYSHNGVAHKSLKSVMYSVRCVKDGK